MEGIIQKLRVVDQERIAVINAPEIYLKQLASALPDIKSDTTIDQRFLYGFMMVFVKNSCDIKNLTPEVLHNLAADGVLWFVYPKKKGRVLKTDINRDRGWEPLNDKGFRPVSQVAIDETMSALRFRNVAYIKTRKK
jgi:hypothetical protein